MKAKAVRCHLYSSGVIALAALKFASLSPQRIEMPRLTASSSPSLQEDELWPGIDLCNESGRGPPSYSL